MSQRRVVQVLLDILELLHIRHGGLALVHHERMIEVHGEGDEHYEHGYDDNRASGRRRERVVPELDPAQNRHLDEEEKEPEDRGKGPG